MHCVVAVRLCVEDQNVKKKEKQSKKAGKTKQKAGKLLKNKNEIREKAQLPSQLPRLAWATEFSKWQSGKSKLPFHFCPIQILRASIPLPCCTQKAISISDRLYPAS